MMVRWSAAGQWVLMILASALLYVLFFRLNDWLFSAFEHAQGINWVFLPAGFRVLLVLTLGLPGALGIFCANLWLDADEFGPDNALMLLLIAVASGFGPWVVMRWMESCQWLDRQLGNITAARLLGFVLAYAVFNALAHQFIRWGFRVTEGQPWLDLWPMIVGDALGALLILYAVKYSLPWWRQLAGGQHA